MDDEYIDYSCSTPLERLSRDVETLLRAWHIIEGSDRHVSFHRKPSTSSSLPSNARTPGRERLRATGVQLTPPRDLESSKKSISSPVPMQFHTPPRNRKDLYVLEDAKKGANDEVRLLRSGKIMFTTTPPNSNHHKDRLTIELQLCLWDAPNLENNGNAGGNSDPPVSRNLENTNSSESKSIRTSNLSLSLISNNKDPFPRYNILSNLSSLFSIGQHLTLSPTSPSSIPTLLIPTIQALVEANHPSGKDRRNRPTIHLSVSEAFRNFAKSKNRVEDDVALHTSALKSLSGMLQMALNTATANCDSRIPAFGIWGHYKPNHKSGAQTDGRNGKETLAQSVMEVPNWMNGGDLFNLASESSVCCMFRRHLEDMRMDADDYIGDDGDESSDNDDEDASGDESIGERRRTTPMTPKRKVATTQDISKHLTPPRNSTTVRRPEVIEQKRLFLPAFLTGKCHAGGSYSATGCEFAIHVVPPGVSYPVHCTTLNNLGKLLLQHCPQPSDRKRDEKKKSKIGTGSSTSRMYQNGGSKQDSSSMKVIISGARHKYTWSKIFNFCEDIIPQQDDLLLASPYSYRYKNSWDEFNINTYGLSWRYAANTHLMNYNDEDVNSSATILNREDYKKSCRAHVLKILYRAVCGAKSKRSRKTIVARKKMEPHWGPFEDPISLVSVDVTWSCGNGSSLKDPLLTLPLRVRSQNTISSHDILEMENTILSTVFNPLTVSPSDFRVSATYDNNAACTTLSATIRCILASLIRVCPLDQSHLMGHLTNPIILEELHQRDELDLVAEEIMNEANVSPMTRRLVEAMEWGSMADALDDDAAINETRMQDIVEQLYVSSSDVAQFPSAPEEVFDDSRCEEEEPDEPFHSNLPKASRPGRLLSILFTSMSGLQTPSAMAALWMAFTSDLRMKWERRERLPNLGPIPGLDEDDYAGKSSRKIKTGFKVRNVSNGIGSKAKNAAFINSTERDPDLNECIINQKLQVFNIGVETMISAEIKRLERERSELKKVNAGYSNETGKNLDNREHNAPQSVEHCGNHSIRSDNSKGLMDKEDDFFDAVGTIQNDDVSAMRDLDISNDVSFDRELITNSGLRRGARCPLHSASLKASSDQLFAPYVQRDTPLTDDLIIERRKMFTRQGSDNSTIQSRVEVAHRLQKRKLISDMSSFKAANPAAGFEDFITWYGNPEDPMNQYEDDDIAVEAANTVHDLISPSKSPEDAAYEALYTLSATRTFWADCWDEAGPISADDQQPLFDAFTSVEMLLLWFESIHPAILINQVLAINISMANFILQASAPSFRLRPVKEALLRLESKTLEALHLLNKDVIKSISNPISSPFSGDFVDPFAYISPETIIVCENVVNLIGSVEIMISRATSLLTKLNDDEDLVQMILEAPEGRNIEAHSCQSRTGIMDEIHSQQQRNSGIATDDMTDMPFPSVREYVLRNLDERNPCQLTTCIGGTFGLESGGTNSTKGGLVLALKQAKPMKALA